MYCWSVGHVMARGVCFDSMPGCNSLVLQMQRVNPFSASAQVFLCSRSMIVFVKRFLAISLYRTRGAARKRKTCHRVQHMGFREETDLEPVGVGTLKHSTNANVISICQAGSRKDKAIAQVVIRLFLTSTAGDSSFHFQCQRGHRVLVFQAIACRCRDSNLVVTNYSTNHIISSGKNNLLPALP